MPHWNAFNLSDPLYFNDTKSGNNEPSITYDQTTETFNIDCVNNSQKQVHVNDGKHFSIWHST